VYDPTAAAAELEAAGLVDSDGDGVRELNGTPTNFGILCDVNNPVEVRATELIAGMLAEAGIGAAQNCLDIDSSVALIWPNFVAVAAPEYDMGIWGWSSGPQFQRGFIKFLTHCEFGTVGWGNLTGICDPTLDERVGLLTANTDPSKTEEYSTQLQERFVENMPFIPLMSPGGNFAYNPSAYDGWVYMKGTGIMTVWSFLPEGAVEIP
jgi:peptide/nickel transport system substrate-binding protein